MSDPFSTEAFCESAREFARSALEAHHAGNHRRVPIDAGTALEHLAKACLADRSPALLAEMKGEGSVASRVGLLRIQGAGPPAVIRTIGLTEALSRISRFVKPTVSREDLQTLAELRNGVVHAADDRMSMSGSSLRSCSTLTRCWPTLDASGRSSGTVRSPSSTHC